MIVPRAIALLAFPFAVSAMVLGVGVSAFPAGLAARARIIAC